MDSKRFLNGIVLFMVISLLGCGEKAKV
ncbi:MAG: hypothetical protein QG577_2127, partial [Thermodesulfobacteriota bacterium]|nr:hypothetical protein [Thermodesulfobacteriota bacterium]